MKRFRLPVKLALAIVPIGLVALAAGAWVSWTSLEEARVEERVSHAAQVAADAMDALVAVSAEREAALAAAVGEPAPDQETVRAATDRTIERLRDSVRELVPRASGPASGIAGAIFSHSSLSGARLEDARAGDPMTEETQELFDEIGNRLITVASQSTLYFGDPGPAREGEGAVSLARASFASFQQEQLLTRYLAEGSPIADEEFEQRITALESTVSDWLTNADDNSPTVRAMGLASSQVPEDPGVPDAEAFMYDRNEVLASSSSEILTRVATAADRAATTVRTEAATVAAVVLGVLLVTAVLALVLGRSTVRRVRSVTSAAQHVADVELPKMVDALSNPKGQLADTVPHELEEGGPDEVGELARSFRSLHGTLVEVANRQMEILRRGVSEIFVTLARRNGSLVDRQLAVIDDLESRQEDPEILDGYYKLDHLATRMRRNAESLLVLAGSESPRMWSDPLEMGEVVRAAMGEVDEYQRVDVLALEPARLKGKVVTDLAHLMSELLDNATQFSPPSERVRVTGLFDDDGYVITIADSGLGISEDRMAEINRLITDPPVLGLALEPTLGMYVVARLAARHGITVRVVPGVPGTTVRITLPRDLLEAVSEETSRPSAPALGDGSPESSDSQPRSVTIPPYAFRSGTHPAGEETALRPDVGEAAAQSGSPELPAERSSRTSPAPAPGRPPADAPIRAEGEEAAAPPPPPGEGDGPKTSRSRAEHRRPTGPSPTSPESAAPRPDPQRSELPRRAPTRPGSESEKPPGKPPATRAPESRPAPEEGSLPRRPTARPEVGRKPSEPKAHGDPPSQPGDSDLSRRHAARQGSERERPAPPPPPRQPSGPGGPEAPRSRPAPPPTTRPVDQESESRPVPGQGRLPTRKPGSSFQGDVAEDGTTTVSKRGAEGIRSALDGYRLGRDIASRPPEGGDDTPERTDDGGEG